MSITAKALASCSKCGKQSEITIYRSINVSENPELEERLRNGSLFIWECPHCHNRDQNKMNVARRTCGYIGTQFWNQGRTQEIRDRVLHL